MVKGGGGGRRLNRQDGLQVILGEVFQPQHLPVALLQAVVLVGLDRIIVPASGVLLESKASALGLPIQG